MSTLARPGAVLLLAAATMGQAGGQETPAITDVRAATIASVDYDRQLIEPGLCVYKTAVEFVVPGPQGSTTHIPKQLVRTAYAFCTDPNDALNKHRIDAGGDDIAIGDLVFAVHALRRLVGVTDFDPRLSVAFETPDLEVALAQGTMNDVSQIKTLSPDRVSAVVQRAHGYPLGIWIERRGGIARRVYVFQQIPTIVN
jgi:hypothetical protein